MECEFVKIITTKSLTPNCQPAAQENRCQVNDEWLSVIKWALVDFSRNFLSMWPTTVISAKAKPGQSTVVNFHTANELDFLIKMQTNETMTSLLLLLLIKDFNSSISIHHPAHQEGDVAIH